MVKYLLLLMLFPVAALSTDTWGPYDAQFVDLYDADSFTLRYEVWKDVEVTSKIRLHGLDTPEKGWRAKCDAESELADEATAFVTDLFANAATVTLAMDKKNVRGKFGRLLGHVTIDGVDLTKLLIAQGYAYAYYGGKRKPWCGW